jgi:hypothetical protein
MLNLFLLAAGCCGMNFVEKISLFQVWVFGKIRGYEEDFNIIIFSELVTDKPERTGKTY